MGSEEDGVRGRDYFGTLEDEFIRLRGSPLLLGPADWRLADAWRQQGVPLWLVVETIRDVFARRAERQQASPDVPLRRVGSLRYCRRAVERAWAEHRELGGADDQARRPASVAIDVRARLEALADSLPESLVDRGDWQRRLLDLHAAAGAAPEVEERLVQLDGELLERCLGSLPAAEQEEVERDAAGAVGRQAHRVDPERRRELQKRMVRRLVRQRLGVPLLSLFAPAPRPVSREDGV